MHIPAHLIEQVRTSSDIVSIVDEFVEIKRKGKNWWGLSPFAQEKTPSFTVNVEKQIFKCFSTGIGGDVFKFMMEKEGMNFPEAVRWVAKKVGVEIEEKATDPEYKKAQAKNQGIMVVNAWAANAFVDWAIVSKSFEKFAAERRLTNETIDKFQIGLSPSGWTELIDLAKEEGYKSEYLGLSGLTSYSEKSGKTFDRFRNRIMFPITDHYGNVKAFGGRKYLPNDNQMGKYINSPETIVYVKSNVLYGLFQAKDSIRSLDMTILNEGYMDVAMMHQNGFSNSVASCGTALTKNQVKLLRRYSFNILLMMDGDQAGKKAALKHIPVLLSEGMNVKVLSLEGEDPDSFLIKYGADALSEKINTALDWLPWTIGAMKDLHQIGVSPSAKAELIRKIDQYIRHIPWDITQELYRKEAAKLLEVSAEMVKQPEKLGLSSSGKRDWAWYQKLIMKSSLQFCPDFFRTEQGDIRVEYRDLIGKPYRIIVSGEKRAASRNITKDGKVQAVYIPPRLREYFSESEDLRSPVSGVPLFLVQDEITASLLDSIGVFAIGLPRRDSFLQKKNSKKLHGLLRQVIGKGFRHVVYLASGEMFSLPKKKGAGDKPYKSVDSGQIARDYIEVMKGLKESLGTVETENLLIIIEIVV